MVVEVRVGGGGGIGELSMVVVAREVKAKVWLSDWQTWECMRVVVRSLCFTETRGRDCVLLIRSRGRWGKCG